MTIKYYLLNERIIVPRTTILATVDANNNDHSNFTAACMRNSKKQEKLKRIQNYCDDLSNTFARLSLELGELIEDEIEVGDKNPDTIPSTTTATKIDDSSFSDASLEDADPQYKRRTQAKANTLFKKSPVKFQEDDIVRINNHYKGKYGDLFGREGIVRNVGKSFVFVKVKGIPVVQQRAENNLLFVSRPQK